jgi:hypothetical protein
VLAPTTPSQPQQLSPAPQTQPRRIEFKFELVQNQVWLSYARFEADPLPAPEPAEGEEEDEEAAAARAEEATPEAAAGRAVRARAVRGAVARFGEMGAGGFGGRPSLRRARAVGGGGLGGGGVGLAIGARTRRGH